MEHIWLGVKYKYKHIYKRFINGNITSIELINNIT